VQRKNFSNAQKEKDSKRDKLKEYKKNIRNTKKLRTAVKIIFIKNCNLIISMGISSLSRIGYT